MTRRTLVTVVVVAALTASAAAEAEGLSTRRLCAKSATLRDSPEGFIIGWLYRPQRLRVERRSANRRWTLVVTRSGVVGWIAAGACAVLDRRAETDDQGLVAAFRRGDDRAFEQIDERHRRPLERHARKILGKASDQAEDVVQEAMLRASRALRRDERQIELRPWLYRLVRNCALDELARVRTDAVVLDDADQRGALRASDATEPEVATERRSRIRDVLGDVAALPEHQRHALLRRELDGVSHTALALELGTTPNATRMLVSRARANLVKHEEARSADCRHVRAVLLEAHDRGRRAPAAVYRHLATCGECRGFRARLKDTRRAVAILTPGRSCSGRSAC